MKKIMDISGNKILDIDMQTATIKIQWSVFLSSFGTLLLFYISGALTQFASQFLDLRIIETPAIAIGQVNKEVARMGNLVLENLNDAELLFVDEDYNKLEVIFEKEQLINKIEREITEYLVSLSKASLSDPQHHHVDKLFYAVNDIERVGDHIENIAELSQSKLDSDLSFSQDAADELRLMFSKCKEAVSNAMIAFTNTDFDSAKKVRVLEEEVDRLERENRDNHIGRLSRDLCITTVGITFLDGMSNLERVSDHSFNISQYVLDEL